MQKSITFHNGGYDKVDLPHNRRAWYVIKNQEHIDKSKIPDDIRLYDVERPDGKLYTIEDFYNDFFNESVEEYNSKQSRADRKINSYYDKIKEDKQKQLCYECIVQIGDMKDTGTTSELEKQALKIFFDEWQERNPNLKIFCAYMHNDEGTSHLHIDYIPVSYDNKRGMRVQNSLKQALKQQGIVGQSASTTAQMLWEQRERMALAEICDSLGIDTKPVKQLDVTKPRSGRKPVRKHLNTQELKFAFEYVQNINQHIIEQYGEVQEPKKRPLESDKSFAERVNTFNTLQQLINQTVLLSLQEEDMIKKRNEFERLEDSYNEQITNAEQTVQQLKTDIAELDRLLQQKNSELEQAELFIKNQAQIATNQAKKIAEEYQHNAELKAELDRMEILLEATEKLQAAEELKKRSADELQQVKEKSAELQEQKAKQSEEFNKMVAEHNQQFSANVESRAEELAHDIATAELKKSSIYQNYIKTNELLKSVEKSYQNSRKEEYLSENQYDKYNDYGRFQR